MNLILLALGTRGALAVTPPIAGAVALPGGAELTLPFPDGTPVRISCGYGPTCSPYHDGTNAGCCTNDYYALDLVRDVAGGGSGEPVLAVAAGTVVAADWASGGWSTFGRMVLVEHDFGDGHVYLSLYAHLSSWSVSVGDTVAPKDEIGTMGGSGNYTDGYFGAHLHYSLYRDASFLGGPYGGNATVPEPIDGYEDLFAGMSLTAGPGPGGGEGGDTTIVVDDADPAFFLVGDPLVASTGGYRGAFFYTPAQDSPAIFGTWTPDIEVTGLYTIAAYVPYSGFATATRAPFTVHAHGEVDGDTQDQSIIGGDFHDLFGGRAFKFVAGGQAYVSLDDGTGETSDVYVAWDALRFVRAGDVGTAGVGEGCGSAADCAADGVCDLALGVCRAPCNTTGCGAGGTCEAATGLCDVWPDGAPTTTSPPPPTGGDPTGTADPPADPDAEGSDPQVYAPPMACTGCATGEGLGSGLGLVLLAGVSAGVSAARRRGAR